MSRMISSNTWADGCQVERIRAAPGYTFTGVIFNTLTHTSTQTHTRRSVQQNCIIIKNLPMNPCWNTQEKLFEVWYTASGEQDYTHKQAAGQSCLSGQWTNWIICEHLRVMGLSDGSDPLTCVLSCLTSCNESNRLWRWCAGSGFSNVGNQKQSGPSGAEQEKEQAVCPSDRVKHAEEARENKSCSKNQKQLKTQSNVPLLCDKIVRMLCTITNRSNCMQAWQYITVTC